MVNTDVLIIGGGPAGLTAAIYALRAGVSVILLESNMYGGQVASTPTIENFPSHGKIDGWELAQSMYDQAKALGMDFRFEAVEGMRVNGDYKVVKSDSEEYLAKSVIIANGARRRKLNIPGEEELSGMGVSYCASCDGAFFKDKTVAVIGGGNTALEDCEYLSGLCEKVYLVHRRDEFRGDASLSEAVKNNAKVEIKYSYIPTEIFGVEDGKVTGLEIRKVNSDDNSETLKVDGVFVCIGLDPDNGIFSDIIEMENGYIKANEDCKTSLAGVYAAGDTRTKKLRQVVTACADGAIAANEAQSHAKTIV